MVQGSHETGGRPTQVDVVDNFKRLASRAAAALRATRASLRKPEDAHAERCLLASFTALEFRDLGIDPSDATGVASWQPALPFFMQSGFGQE